MYQLLRIFLITHRSSIIQEDSKENIEFYLKMLNLFAKRRPECFSVSDDYGQTPFYFLVRDVTAWIITDNSFSFPYKEAIETIFRKTASLQIDRMTYDGRNTLHVLLQSVLPSVIGEVKEQREPKIQAVSDTLNLFLDEANPGHFSTLTSDPKQGICDLLWERDATGKTPLHYAFERGNTKAAQRVLKFLFENGRAPQSFLDQQFKVIKKDGGVSFVRGIQQWITEASLQDYVDGLKPTEKEIEQKEYSASSVARLIQFFDKRSDHGSKSKPTDKPMSPLQRNLFDLSESLKKLKFGLGRLQSGLKSLGSKLGL